MEGNRLWECHPQMDQCCIAVLQVLLETSVREPDPLPNVLLPFLTPEFSYTYSYHLLCCDIARSHSSGAEEMGNPILNYHPLELCAKQTSFLHKVPNLWYFVIGMESR